MWLKIEMPCPECVKEHGDCSPQVWTHGNSCRGNLYLDEKGYVHCLKCHKSAHIRTMYFSCSSYKHAKAQMSGEAIAAALMMSKLDNSVESLKWVKSIIEDF